MELEREVRYHLAQMVELESPAKKVEENRKAAQNKVDAISCDSRISKQELHLKEAEDRSLEAKEGQSVSESDLSLRKEPRDSFGFLTMRVYACCQF